MDRYQVKEEDRYLEIALLLTGTSLHPVSCAVNTLFLLDSSVEAAASGVCVCVCVCVCGWVGGCCLVLHTYVSVHSLLCNPALPDIHTYIICTIYDYHYLYVCLSLTAYIITMQWLIL